jgi:MoaA/NifB/PqqE/SkfB family radical SAM enzyme
MNSNGAFPFNRVRDILRADRIVINIGESDRKSYEELQGQDFFLRVIKNIRELSKLKKIYNPNFHIVAVLIKNTMNVDRLEKTTALLKKIGVDDVRHVKAEAWEYTQDIMLPESLSEPAPKEWLPCYHGWFYSSIKLDGRVNLCCFMQELKIDTVGEKSFKDVWLSEDYAKARAAAVSGKGFEHYRECKNCPIAFRNREFGTQLQTFLQMNHDTRT